MAFPKIKPYITKWYLIVFTICSFEYASAQHKNVIETQTITLEALISAEKYDEAVCYGEELIDVIQNEAKTNNDTLVAKVFNLIGLSHAKLNQLTASNFYFQQSIQGLNKQPSTALAKAYQGLGDNYRESKKYPAAEEQYQSALKIIKHLYPSQSIYEASVLVSLSEMEKDKGLDFSLLERYSQEALNMFKRLNVVNDEVVNALYNLGLVKQEDYQYQEALELYKKGLAIIEQQKSNNSPRLVNMLHRISQVQILMGAFKDAQIQLNRALELNIKHFGPQSPNAAKTYRRLGNLYAKQYNNHLALDYYNKAQAIDQKNPESNPLELGYGYFLLAGIHREQGNYEKAIQFYQKDMALMVANLPKGHHFMGDNYSWQAETFLVAGKYDEAMEVLLKSQAIILPSLGDAKRFYYHHTFGRIHLKSGNYLEAIKELEMATQLTDNIFRQITIQRSLGLAYQKLNDNTKAIDHLKQALDKANEFYNSSNPYTTVINLNLGEIYLEEKNYEKLLECFSIIEQQVNYDPVAPYQFENINFHELLQDYLHLKAKYLKQRLEKSNTTTYRDTLISLHEYAFAFLDFIQVQVTDPSSKQEILANSYLFFEQAIDFYISLNTPEAIEKAFSTVERSKNVSLSESLRISQAETIAGIPQSLLNKEHEINARLTFYQHKIQEEKYTQSTPRDSLLIIYQDSLFEANRAKEQLILNFEKKYPGYYALKYDHSTIELSTVQKALKPDETILEYFVGDSSIFLFTIQKEKIQAHKIQKSFPLQEWIKQMRQSTYTYWISFEKPDSAYVSNKNNYAEVAHQLYLKLIEPVSGELTERVLIIPDGPLVLLPYDALLHQKPTPQQGFADFPFLLKKHIFSYDYAVGIHFQNKGKPANKRLTFSGFAPQFKNESIAQNRTIMELRNSLSSLNNNEEEVENIHTLFNGTIFTGEQATKAMFLDQSAKAKILHLATHAKANEQAGDQSFIAFSEIEDSSIINERLYVRELYNLNLNSEMVVLSACETGLGEFRRGEGLISLARGFTFAGTKSVVPSLWKVDDQATADFMYNFYQALKAGQSKDEALRNAKLQSISNTQTAAPFFWAAFVPIGDMEPLVEKWPISNLWIILGIAFLGISFLAYRYKRKK